ncbi:hypothetical protein [Maribacter sp.]|uniref:hypothetical protein n=1 Tax=Maribacter sp. TaxID=1897614 RepID=UPI0025C29744|nr:hypothetical protein [Maribacter sp.]
MGKVGKNGDCDGGSTRGSGSPDPMSNTPAGGSFTHTYQGHTVTSNFRDRDIQIPYGYSITINPGDGSSSTVVTNAITPVETITAGISDMGTAPTATLPNYSSETVTWTESRVDWGPGPDGGSGGSTRTECSRTVITMGSMRFETGISCVQISNHNKSYSPGINKTGACLDTSGVTAINTAAKPIQKLHGYIGLNANEIEYFNRDDTNRAKARQINRFLIGQNFSLQSIELAKEVVNYILEENSEYPSCQSFEFSTVVGNDGWKAAGVSGVWDVAWKFGKCPGLAMASFSEPVYFQLPGYYNYEIAASTSALLLWTAFENWGAWYRRTYAVDCVSDWNPLIREQLMIEMKEAFEEIGGRVDRVPPPGFNGIITQYKEAGVSGNFFCN